MAKTIAVVALLLVAVGLYFCYQNPIVKCKKVGLQAGVPEYKLTHHKGWCGDVIKEMRVFHYESDEKLAMFLGVCAIDTSYMNLATYVKVMKGEDWR